MKVFIYLYIYDNYNIKNTIKSLIPENPKTATFYTIPKLHKLPKIISEKHPNTFSSDPHQITQSNNEENIYEISKTLKIMPPGRPIISGIGTLTELISGYIDNILKPLLPDIPSYIRDTTDFLSKLQNINLVHHDTILVTMDVSSLYTNIPHVEGVSACYEFLSNKKLPNYQITDICQ